MPIRTINIHQAKTHLSKLVEQAARGEPFIIAKAGKPMVMVTPLDAAPVKKSPIGFMQGQMKIPDDFDTMGQEEIIALFEGDK